MKLIRAALISLLALTVLLVACVIYTPIPYARLLCLGCSAVWAVTLGGFFGKVLFSEKGWIDVFVSQLFNLKVIRLTEKGVTRRFFYRQFGKRVAKVNSNNVSKGMMSTCTIEHLLDSSGKVIKRTLWHKKPLKPGERMVRGSHDIKAIVSFPGRGRQRQEQHASQIQSST